MKFAVLTLIFLGFNLALAQQLPDLNFLSIMPKPGATTKPAKADKKQKNKNRIPAQETPGQPVSSTEPPTPEVEQKSVIEGTSSKFQNLMFGGDLSNVNQKRTSLEPDDIRRNIFDLTVSTQYFYNHSQSNYFYRNYISSSPGAFLGIDLWLTPYLAVDVGYRFSILGNVKDSPTAETFVSADQSWTDFGLKWRRFFSDSSDSASFSFSLKYTDYQFSVPTTSANRMKTRMRGPQLAFDLTVPSSKSFFWTAGVNFKPFMSQDEIVGNSDLRTGTSNQAIGVGASLGGEYRLNRKVRAFFNLSANLYRTQYSGTSAAVDPITGSTTTNASVNNIFYFLDLGFKFGR